MLQRWHHPRYEMKWNHYGCISRFIKGVRYGRSITPGFLKKCTNGLHAWKTTVCTSEWSNIRAEWHAIQGSTGFDIGLALSTLYANDLNDNHDFTAFHINMQTTRLSWSTVPLQIWTLPLAPCKPSISGQAIPTYCLMQNRPKNYDMHRKNVKSAK